MKSKPTREMPVIVQLSDGQKVELGDGGKVRRVNRRSLIPLESFHAPVEPIQVMIGTDQGEAVKAVKRFLARQ